MAGTSWNRDTYLEMIQQPARDSDEEVDTFLKPLNFRSSVGSAHDNANCLGMVLHQFLCYAKYLQRKLSRWSKDYHSGACAKFNRRQGWTTERGIRPHRFWA